MTRYFLTLACLLAITTLHAQKKESDEPAFGKVDKADLEMKDCSFDPKAEAVVLFDVGELYCDINMQANTITMDLERHVRIKILKDKGFDNANIRIRYHSYRNDEYVKGLTAQTYNLDAGGNIVPTKVEKSAIFDKPINKRYNEVVFTFPALKAGSIIEYQYTIKNVGLRDWYFQRSIPVKYSRYRIDFPNELEVYATPFCSLPYASDKAMKGQRTLQMLSMKEVPALRDEPYISCEDDYLQRIDVRLQALNLPLQRVNLVKQWPNVIKNLMEDEDFGVQLKRNIPRTTDLDEQLKTISDPYRRMVTIHEYVRKNMEWNGTSNIWALEGVRSAWKDHKGTSGEINLILVNLLKDAGLKAHAVLVSTRSNGIVATSIADVSQFDKVLAYVEIDERVFVLDGTEKYTPSYLIPKEVMYSEGLVIEKPETFEWGWKPLWNEATQQKSVLILQAVINEEGIMKGELSLNSYDYARVQRIADAKKDKDKFLEKYFKSDNPGSTVEGLEFDNLEADSLPLIQKVKFSIPVSASGDYKYFTTNLFTGLEKNPFVADNRFSDVFFGVNQSYSIVANITIPPGYAFEALPKNTRMIMPDTSISITRRIAVENNQLGIRVALEFKKPYFTVQDYPDFKEFYKQLFALLSEQVAIKKKS